MSFLKNIFKNAGGKESPKYGGERVISYTDPKTVDFMESITLNPWVYSAIKAKKDALSKANFKIYKGIKKGGEITYRLVTEHRAIKILENPNDYMSHSDMLEQMSVDLDTAGETFWNIRFTEGQIWHLEPDRISIHKKKGGRGIEFFYYRNDDGFDIRFIPEEIMHIKSMPNPTDRYRGISPLKACAIVIDGDIYADSWNRDFFKNAARPDGILYSEQSVSKEKRFEWMTAWKEKFFGSKRGSVGVLSGGVRYEKVGDGQKDMDFSKLSENAEKKILAVLGVPREILGDMGSAATDTAASSRISFFSDTIYPRLRKIQSALTSQFMNRYYSGDEYIEYDDPTPENIELKIKKRESDIKIGARTPNEIRQDDGFDAVEGGDEIYIGLREQSQDNILDIEDRKT